MEKLTSINALLTQYFALYLKCTMDEILNEASLIINMSGIYRAIKYQWKSSQDHLAELHIWDDGKEAVLDKGDYSQARFYAVYRDMTELIIDEYLEQKEVEVMLNG